MWFDGGDARRHAPGHHHHGGAGHGAAANQQGSGTTPANIARLQQWYDHGYAGAWGWSLFPDNTADRFPTDLAALKAFDQLHPDTSPH
jgi:hypothetical protein